MADIEEFWIRNEYAPLLLKPGEGNNNGSCTIIRVPREDPRIEMIRNLRQWVREQYDDYLFLFSCTIRKYTEEELVDAKLFHVLVKKVFEPAGEQCGTTYDETQACDICGVNASQVGSLRLRTKTIPRKPDVSGTFAREWVFSSRFKAVCETYPMKGILFQQIHNRQDKPIDFFQIQSIAPKLTLTDNTITGIDLFDLSESCENEVYKCPKGGDHNIGLNQLSELYVKKIPEINQYDFFQTRQKIGVKRGWNYPRPMYLCSPAFRKMVLYENLKGFVFQIAHIE